MRQRFRHGQADALKPDPIEPDVIADLGFDDKADPEPLGNEVAGRLATFGDDHGLQLHASLLRSLHDPCLGFRSPLTENEGKSGKLCNGDTGGWRWKGSRAGDGDDR